MHPVEKEEYRDIDRGQEDPLFVSTARTIATRHRGDKTDRRKGEREKMLNLCTQKYK